jgi:replication factor C subunit 1
MDIRRFLTGGNKKPDQNTGEQEKNYKRPVEDTKDDQKKSFKASKYFTDPVESSGSETEEIPSSPEQFTVKKQLIPSQTHAKILDHQSNDKPSRPSVVVKSDNLSKTEKNLKKIESSSKPANVLQKPQKIAKTSKKPNEGQVSGPLSGKTFVITGVFTKYNRETLTDLIKEQGGKVTGSVSGRTSYLVHGHILEDGREYHLGKKYIKAKELGTKIIDEEEINQMLDSYLAQKPDENDSDDESENLKTIKPMNNAASPIKNVVNLIKTSNYMNKDTLSSLWVDKYKPKSLEDIIGNTQTIKKLQEWLEDWESVILNHCNKPLSPGKNGKFDAKVNTNAPAVLISGSPGIGKTTCARLLASQYGYRVMEMNASDIRSKKLLLEPLLSSSKSHCLSDKGNIVKNLIIMDEIDGMSGGDRGGTSALIQVIKTSKNPIICICNDRQSAKVKSLANYCYDLKFAKPSKIQITKRICAILTSEGINAEPNAVEQFVEASGNDIRQILTSLEMWARSSFSLSYMKAKQALKTMSKDPVSMLSHFDAASKLFNKTEMKKLKHKEKINMVFIDYDLIPLLVHENYLSALDEAQLLDMADAADSIAISDCFNKEIRTNNNWSVLPEYLNLSCVHPTFLCTKSIPFAAFPQWFGKNSTQKKNERLIKELQTSLSKFTYSNYETIVSEYVPLLSQIISKDFTEKSPEEAAETLYLFNLTPEMVKDNLGSLAFKVDFGINDITASSKKKITLAYNKIYKNSLVKSKKNAKNEDETDKFDPEYQEAQNLQDDLEESSEEIEAKPTFKAKKKNKNYN